MFRPAIARLICAILLSLTANPSTAQVTDSARILSFLISAKFEGVGSTWDFASASVPARGHAPRITVVYMTNHGQCGNAGCDILVLSLKNGRYHVVKDIPTVEAPITFRGRSNDGYPVFGVVYEGHNIPGGTAGLDRGELKPKNGRYPDESTRLPAHAPHGRILISDTKVVCNFRRLPPAQACERLLKREQLVPNHDF